MAYTLSGRNADGVTTNAAASSKLTNAEVLHEGGRTTIIFTRPLDNGVKTIAYDGDTSIIYAFGRGSTINYHDANRKVIAFNFATGVATEDTTQRDAKIVHGSLMIVSWGFLLPLGTLAAAWGGPRFKNGGPRPFHMHRVAQSVGLLVAIAGAVYALVQLYDATATMPVHGVLGMIVTIVGMLQPLMLSSGHTVMVPRDSCGSSFTKMLADSPSCWGCGTV